MAYLPAAVGRLGAVSLLTLARRGGLVRRLRPDPGGPTGDHLAATGSVIGDFAVIAVDGATVSPAMVTGPTLVGFFAPGCEPCTALIPRFVAAAASYDRAVAVVAEGEDDSGYVADLSTVATVVRDDQAGPVVEAFAVTGFPAVCVVGAGGIVTATGIRLVPDLRPVPA